MTQSGSTLTHQRLTFFDSQTESSHAIADQSVISFLHGLSRAILGFVGVREYSDLVTFAYFVRKANLNIIGRELSGGGYRRGLGYVVHIAPANIPLNFAYSLVFGLLAGNANWVRLPSSTFPQVEVLSELIKTELDKPANLGIRDRVHLFRSEKGSDELKELIAKADGLVVWGGDATVSELRSYKKKTTARELYFPSRVSSALIAADRYLKLPARDRDVVALKFYNDTYLVDQNACSSPSVVAWVGSEVDCEQASEHFWSSVAKVVRAKYESWSTAGVDKLLDLFGIVTDTNRAVPIRQQGNFLWVTSDQELAKRSLRFGIFSESFHRSVGEALGRVRPNEQTITHFGIDPIQIYEETERLGLRSVERICPFGEALDMGVIWDGKDIIALLSRTITVK